MAEGLVLTYVRLVIAASVALMFCVRRRRVSLDQAVGSVLLDDLARAKKS
jgi:hypothetical protein